MNERDPLTHELIIWEDEGGNPGPHVPDPPEPDEGEVV